MRVVDTQRFRGSKGAAWSENCEDYSGRQKGKDLMGEGLAKVLDEEPNDDFASCSLMHIIGKGLPRLFIQTASI